MYVYSYTDKENVCIITASYPGPTHPTVWVGPGYEASIIIAASVYAGCACPFISVGLPSLPLSLPLSSPAPDVTPINDALRARNGIFVSFSGSDVSITLTFQVDETNVTIILKDTKLVVAFSIFLKTIVFANA